MSIKSLTLEGLRGFSSKQSLQFAQPSSKEGSGLTILVGPNNGGKSTVVEAMNVFSKSREPSFPEGQRNKTANDCVSIQIEYNTDSKIELKTVEEGGSETKFEPPISNENRPSLYVLPSRRYFNPHFHKGGGTTRQNYPELLPDNIRGILLNEFSHRLFRASSKTGEKFNDVLQKVMDPVPDWHY